jgi:hypothetical protein
MIYEIHLKLRIKNESREISYFEAWRMEGKCFLPYDNPILEQVFKQKWPLEGKIPPPEPSDVYMVLVEAENTSSKELKRVFTKGRNLIKDYLTEQESPTFLVFAEKEAE